MKIRESKWLCFCVMLLVLGVTTFIQPSVFYLNDDMTIRSVLNGSYTGTPDGHTVYMQYPLTGILAMLYRIMDFVPWLEVFYIACFLLCMVLFARQFKNPFLGCLSSVVLYLPFFVYMHYTLVAALIAATGVFLLVMGKKDVWPLLLVLLAYLIRNEVGLLSLPFVACALVWQVVISPKAEWKQLVINKLKYCVVLSGVIFLCFGINYVSYSSAEWKSYLEYNEGRTLLYDYTDFLSTDYYAKNYESYSMTRDEYYILSSYDIMLAGEIQETKMQEVSLAVSGGLLEKLSFVERCKDCVYKYYVYLRYNDLPYNYIWLAACILLLLGFAAYKKWMQLLVLGVLGVGRSCIWLFLIWQGRFPQRISVSLYMIELLLLLGMGIWFLREVRPLKSKLRPAVTILLVAGLVILSSMQWYSTNSKVEKQRLLQKEWDTLVALCGEDSEILYLADVFSVVSYSGQHYSEDPENIMLLGGWMSASPLARQRLAEYGATDAAQALYDNEDVLLLAAADADVSWLEEYLQNRFGNCELVVSRVFEVEGTEGFVAYAVESTQN